MDPDTLIPDDTFLTDDQGGRGTSSGEVYEIDGSDELPPPLIDSGLDVWGGYNSKGQRIPDITTGKDTPTSYQY